MYAVFCLCTVHYHPSAEVYCVTKKQLRLEIKKNKIRGKHFVLWKRIRREKREKNVEDEQAIESR